MDPTHRGKQLRDGGRQSFKDHIWVLIAILTLTDMLSNLDWFTPQINGLLFEIFFILKFSYGNSVICDQESLSSQ